MARAEAYGRAVSNIFITNDVCPNCTAVASAMVETSMRVIDEATAEAWIAVRLYRQNRLHRQNIRIAR